MSKLTDHAPSPKWILDIFQDYFDPCPSAPAFNGLKIPWTKKNYVNPPYSTKIPWIKKAIIESDNGNKSFMLLPVDTSTKWFWDLITPYFLVHFFTRRIELGNGHHPKFPSMIAETIKPAGIQIPSGLPNLRAFAQTAK